MMRAGLALLALVLLVAVPVAAQTILPMKRLLDMGFEVKGMAATDGVLRFVLQKGTVAYLCHGTETCERIL